MRDSKHIVLLGKGKGFEKVPTNTEQEIWGLNGLLFDKGINTRLDKIFMMDVINEMPSVVAGLWNERKIIDKINELNIPFVAPYKYDEIPKSEAFPIEEIIKQYGSPYFNNTIAYMIAYALVQGVQSIDLWGINQASGSEYFYEKGCVEFWLGVAIGKGVTIKIGGQWSELLTNKARYGGNLLYGYNRTVEEYLAEKKRFGEKSVQLIETPKQELTVKEQLTNLN